MQINDLNYISSCDNDKIKQYRKLASDKKQRRKDGMFVIEGARLVSDAADMSIEIKTVFITEAAAEKYSELLSPLYTKYPQKIFNIISPSAAKSLSDTQMPQGVFAVCAVPPLDKSQAYGKIGKGGKYLILDNIQDPGNMGTMLRTADACGIDAVVICGCCDIYNPKAVRSAMGSLMRVNIIEDNIENAVLEFKSRQVTVFAAVIDKDAADITKCGISQGGAVIIGNEGSGIPREHVMLADVPVTIKMHGTVNSLNAAMAAGIIMWELSKQQ